jgi:DNA mismatch repair protein MutL
LSSQLVNQIAAGEVIERPASVVKELIENSLDASAANIEITVEEGGRKLIRVQDNGTGILPEDLQLAIESHATSKLRTAEELACVNTLGFRGEALASMAAVSRLEITSRPAGSDFGAKIVCDAGRFSDVQPVGCPPGTAVSVENLFYNTPARRKFLKSDSAEIASISEAVMRAAIANPNTAFGLFHNGRKVFRVPEADSVIERIAALYGREVADALLHAEGAAEDAQVIALAGSPSQSRATGRMEFFFVNGRPVRDRGLQFSVREAFEGYLPAGRHPIVFLFISADGGSVDVNVHPAKAEVRFRNAREIHALSRRILRGVLEKNARGGGAVAIEQSLLDDVPPHPGRRERIERLVGQYIHRERARAAEQAAFGFPKTKQHFDPGARSSGGAGGAESVPTANISMPQAPVQAEIGEIEPAGIGQAELGEFADNFFQVHNSYIILETSRGISIIDQHALHERILFEELRDKYGRSKLETQRLLIPEVLELDAAMREVLESNRELMESFGFEISDFGPMAVSISTIPQILERAKAADLVADLLDELKDAPEAADAESSAITRLLKRMSCRAAVKAGTRLSRGEILALLEKQSEHTGIFTCPHGRPTTISLTLEDLEKQFNRR